MKKCPFCNYETFEIGWQNELCQHIYYHHARPCPCGLRFGYYDFDKWLEHFGSKWKSRESWNHRFNLAITHIADHLMGAAK